MIENIQGSAVDLLVNEPAIQNLASLGVLGLDEYPDGTDMLWVFQGNDDDQPFRDPHGTGTSAIVATVNDGWGANAHNTQKFPRLRVLVYADLTRGPEGEIVARDAKNRALQVAETVIDVLHDPGNQRDPNWPNDVCVLSCICEDAPTVYPIPNSDGMYRAAVVFRLALG